MFRFVESIKRILLGWSSHSGHQAPGYLDILISNAAQTLTDPIAVERKAIQSELKLQQLLGRTTHVINDGYEATIRGGAQRFGGLLESRDTIEVDMSEPYTSYSSPKNREHNGDLCRIFPRDQRRQEKSHSRAYEIVMGTITGGDTI